MFILEEKDMQEQIEKIFGITINNSDKTEKEQIEEILNINLED